MFCAGNKLRGKSSQLYILYLLYFERRERFCVCEREREIEFVRQRGRKDDMGIKAKTIKVFKIK
jgi:hypothetical protein